MKNTIVVIDPIISSEFLLNRFQEKKIGIIAITTLNLENDYFNYEHLPFSHIIKSSGNVSEDIKKIVSISDIKLLAGFYGSEATVPYADKLLRKLFPEASNYKNSIFRYDKFSMNDALKKVGIPSIKQEKIIADLLPDQAIKKTQNFFKENENKIVIKPTSGSAGSVGVYVPNSFEDIVTYFAQDDLFLFNDSDFVIQEKLEGVEYYIDSASFQGKHIITTIGRYNKVLINGNYVYQYVDALDINDPELFILKDYVLKILETLGVNTGLAHTEVLKTKKGYRLIEINPRISGIHGVQNMMAKGKNQQDQIDAFVALLYDKKINHDNNDFFYRSIFLKNTIGVYKRINYSAIRQHESFLHTEVFCEAQLQKPNEKQTLVDICAMIMLRTNCRKTLEQDTKSILAMESDGSAFIC